MKNMPNTKKALIALKESLLHNARFSEDRESITLYIPNMAIKLSVNGTWCVVKE